MGNTFGMPTFGMPKLTELFLIVLLFLRKRRETPSEKRERLYVIRQCRVGLLHYIKHRDTLHLLLAGSLKMGMIKATPISGWLFRIAISEMALLGL